MGQKPPFSSSLNLTGSHQLDQVPDPKGRVGGRLPSRLRYGYVSPEEAGFCTSVTR